MRPTHESSTAATCARSAACCPPDKGPARLAEQWNWAASKPDAYEWLIKGESRVDAYYGRFKESRHAIGSGSGLCAYRRFGARTKTRGHRKSGRCVGYCGPGLLFADDSSGDEIGHK